MKKINYLFVLLTAGTLFATSCGKDGAVGPAGAAGSTGAAGAAGAVGATGADGTKIYSGTAAPDATLGATGDFFINLTTSGFYGPKTAAGWGSPFSLKGATGATGAKGADGADGSTILNGNTAPAATLGADGDYYLNTVNYSFYGPKISGTWPAPVNLKGPKGDPGTANVIYSDWFTPSAYVTTTVFSTKTFTYNMPEPKITQDILDKGTVIVFAKLNGYNPAIWPTDQVSQLPVVINYLSGTTPEIDIWSGLYTLGNLQISVKNNNNVYGSLATAHSYRYVIIPGGVKISSLNLKNYNELKAQLHIQD